MTALLQEEVLADAGVEHDVAWMHPVTGLEAEKLLRGQKPFTFILRTGEKEAASELAALDDLTNYYVTFVDATGHVRHQPFTIIKTEHGWCYENGGYGGPYNRESIQDVLHKIVHADCKENMIPFNNS
jgi:hypothetical protein